MKFTILASLLASATAFAPATQPKATTALQAESPFANELGAQAPLGFWDPLNILEGKDKEEFDRLRFVELKHGRIAMLAFLGNIVTLSGVRFPGMLSSDVAFADLPSGLEGLRQMPVAGLAQIFVFIAFMEIGTSTLAGKGEFLGDFTGTPGQPDMRWSKQTDEWKQKKLQIELNNGRAAQMGILALMVHEQLGNLNEILYLN